MKSLGQDTLEYFQGDFFLAKSMSSVTILEKSDWKICCTGAYLPGKAVGGGAIVSDVLLNDPATLRVINVSWKGRSDLLERGHFKVMLEHLEWRMSSQLPSVIEIKE